MDDAVGYAIAPPREEPRWTAAVYLPVAKANPPSAKREARMLKIIGWAVLIIFIIGLLVVIGVFKAIF